MQFFSFTLLNKLEYIVVGLQVRFIVCSYDKLHGSAILLILTFTIVPYKLPFGQNANH